MECTIIILIKMWGSYTQLILTLIYKNTKIQISQQMAFLLDQGQAYKFLILKIILKSHSPET